MGGDFSSPGVSAGASRPLNPLTLPNKLAATPVAPKFFVRVKNQKGEEIILADPAANRALIALMNTHAVIGGAACHWGGPAAFAEIISAAHGIMFAEKNRLWHEAYNFVNDAGHAENGIYALRANYGFDGMTMETLKGFRSLQSKLTGHGESHINPEGVFLSNGPLGSALPQSEGLALADKLAGRDRVTLCVMSDGAAMEGEAREAFASIPGLAAKGKLNPYVLMISDNDTKLSGRISKDSFSMQPTFQSLATLGWNVMTVENGHDLQAVYSALEKGIQTAKQNSLQPVCLWIKTIKGYGVKATEQNSSGGHGFPLKDGEKIIEFVNEICGGNPPAEIAQWAQTLRLEWEQKQEEKKNKPASAGAKKDKVQIGIAQGMIQAAQEGYPVFSISSDLAGSTGTSAFQKAFPDRCIDLGVAEANMVSVGAGLAKAGFIPVVDTFAQFGVTKGNLPLTMASLSQAPVIAVFSHVGFQDAADGASHQATTYFSAVSAIPNTVVIACSCAHQAQAFMFQAIQRYAQARQYGDDGENIIFFIGRENFPLDYVENPSYQWGKPQILSRGKDVALVASGAMMTQAIEAEKILKEKGISASVVDHPFVNAPDVAAFSEIIQSSGGRLVTIEDHQTIGGMGAILVHALAQHGVQFKAQSLGIRGEFGQSAYFAKQLYQARGLSPEAIAQSLLSI
ncbi:MAG: transketolase C-terminal domain-containing protein [Verrucomicrobiota bacterium]